MVNVSRFSLQQESLPEILNPTSDDIEETLKTIHPRINSFFILSRQDNSYVQCAGARSRLIVEYRQTVTPVVQHFVLGKILSPFEEDNKQLEMVSINYSGGAIQLRRHQILTVQDAITIFLSFFHGIDRLTEYTYEDVSKRFC